MTTLGRAASLGDTLRHIRESKDMTLRAASAATGISNAYISQIETGRIVTPSPTFLRRLALGYGVSYDELMRVAGYTDATSDATPIAPPPILGRAASLRVAYQAALHDLAQVTAERDALLRFIEKQADAERRADTYFNAAETATARADAAEAEVARLRAFVVENGVEGSPPNDGICLGCNANWDYWRKNMPHEEYHESGCIVAEARRAQKEATQ